jgi:hypothetical protein
MSKTPVKATKEKPRQPRFPDGKFFHDVPLFGLDMLKPRTTKGDSKPAGTK